MVIIRKYLAKHVFYYFSLIALLLLGVHFALEISYEIGTIGQGNFGVKEAFLCSLLYLPYDLYSFSPIAVMLAILWGFGTLKINQELIIIRLNGYSIFRLLKEVTYLILGLIILLFLLGEEISPKSLVMANKIKIQAIYCGKFSINNYGNWLKYGDFILSFNKINGENIRELVIYKISEVGNVSEVYQSSLARVNADCLVLFNVKISKISDEKIEQISHLKYSIPIKISNKIQKNKGIQKIKKDVNQYSLKELRANYLEHRDLGLDYLREEVIYWQRVFTPLAILIMAWLGVMFTLKNERGKTASRLLVGVMISFIYYTLTQMSGYVAVVYGYSTWVCTLLPSIGGLLVISWLLVKNQ